MATTVVAATYGVLPEFDPDRDSVKSYTARAKVFFKANSIVEEKQAPIFLSCIGARTYDLLESLLAPTTLDEATFETLVKTSLVPRPCAFVACSTKFAQRAWARSSRDVCRSLRHDHFSRINDVIDELAPCLPLKEATRDHSKGSRANLPKC